MTPRELVVREAYEWLGTPYHHHARIKGAGVDCVNLLCGVFHNIGVVHRIDTGFYAHDWHLHRSEDLFSQSLMNHATEITDGSPAEPGDVFLFRYGRTFSHGAIYVGDGLLIHSYIDRGVILSGFHEEPLLGRKFQHWSVFK